MSRQGSGRLEDLSELVRQIVARHGRNVVGRADAFAGLVQDERPQLACEVFLLKTAAQLLGGALEASRSASSDDLDGMVRRLRNARCLSAEGAHWAIATLARGLQLGSPSDFRDSGEGRPHGRKRLLATIVAMLAMSAAAYSLGHHQRDLPNSEDTQSSVEDRGAGPCNAATNLHEDAAPVVSPPLEEDMEPPKPLPARVEIRRAAPVRSRASARAAPLCTLAAGVRAEVVDGAFTLEEEKRSWVAQWYKVKCDSDTVGWVHRNFVKND